MEQEKRNNIALLALSFGLIIILGIVFMVSNTNLQNSANIDTITTYLNNHSEYYKNVSEDINIQAEDIKLLKEKNSQIREKLIQTNTFLFTNWIQSLPEKDSNSIIEKMNKMNSDAQATINVNISSGDFELGSGKNYLALTIGQICQIQLYKDGNIKCYDKFLVEEYCDGNHNFCQ